MSDVRDLQAFLRTSAQRGRLVVRVAPVTGTIDEGGARRVVN